MNSIFEIKCQETVKYVKLDSKKCHKTDSITLAEKAVEKNPVGDTN